MQVEKFSQCDEDVGVVYGRGYRYFTDVDRMLPVDLPLYRGWVLEKFIKEPNFVYPVTPMFKRECFDFARPDENYRAEGEAIYLKIALKFKFDYIEDYVGVMRDHSYNTGKITEMMYRDNVRYWNEFFLRKDVPNELQALKYIPLARIHRLKGLEAILLDGRCAEGRNALFKAVAFRKSLVFDYKVLAAILLSFFPSKFFNFILRYYR